MFDFIGKIQILGFKLGVQVHYEALQKIVILRWLARGKDQGHRGEVSYMPEHGQVAL